MSLLGEILGYNSAGDDLLGVNREPESNCIACGLSAFSHTPEMTRECQQKLWADCREKGNQHE